MRARIFSSTLGPIFPPLAELRNTSTGDAGAVVDVASAGGPTCRASSAVEESGCCWRCCSSCCGSTLTSPFSMAALSPIFSLTNTGPFEGTGSRNGVVCLCFHSKREQGGRAMMTTMLRGEQHNRIPMHTTTERCGTSTTGVLLSVQEV